MRKALKILAFLAGLTAGEKKVGPRVDGRPFRSSPEKTSTKSCSQK